MIPAPDPASDSYQTRFDARWGVLRDPRVRALAWLLDAPGLLDAGDPYWDGKVLALPVVTPEVSAWLFALDADPSTLDAAFGARVFTRLGLYAEKLMAFYYREQGVLVAHGLQVRATRNDTVGEFDFLVDAGAGSVAHIEFATKFYLLQSQDPDNLDALVGPNLADSLGAKMRKIIDRQLLLGQHPAALAQLTMPVVSAQALVKGWLFYPLQFHAVAAIRGIAPDHCRGFWCALDELESLPNTSFVILPKLQWLAPYRTTDTDTVLSRTALQSALSAQFAINDSPVLIALLRPDGIEYDRGFIVPTTWRTEAAARAIPQQSGSV